MNNILDLYNFHDCYMLFPFKICGDKIIITFNLAKHIQNEDIKARYVEAREEKYHLIKIEYRDCNNIKFIEEAFADQHFFKATKKEVIFDNFDTDLDFISASISSENNTFYAYFSDYEQKRGHVSFNLKDVVLTDEATLQELPG